MKGIWAEAGSYFAIALGIELAEIESIFGIVCFALSIALSITGLIMKIIVAKKNDGKIDAEEAQDILNDINNIKENIDKYGKDK